jgi:hypothetical protein
VLAREREELLGPLLGQLLLPAELMEDSGKEQSDCQAIYVSQLPGQRQRLVAPMQGLVWIAQPPQGHAGIGSAHHPGVQPVVESMGPVLQGNVEGDPLRIMRLGRSELSQIVQGGPEGIVGLYAERWVADLLGQGEEVLPQLSGRL